jgi:carboxylesterase type B
MPPMERNTAAWSPMQAIAASTNWPPPPPPFSPSPLTVRSAPQAPLLQKLTPTPLNSIAGRRLAAKTWTAASLPVYSFRFNAIPAWATQLDGATHFVEVAFAQNNVLGVGYEPARTPPFQGKPPGYARLAALMSADIACFAATGDPNAWAGRAAGGVVEPWPVYGDGRNFVYDANVTSYVEEDDWRAEGIEAVLAATYV